MSGLEPDTDYDIYCFGSSQYGEITQSMLSTMKRIHTEKGRMTVSGITLSDHTISYSVNSNILLTATCSLFDANSFLAGSTSHLVHRIESVKTSLISTTPIFFTGVDLTQHYSTQCVAIAGNRGGSGRVPLRNRGDADRTRRNSEQTLLGPSPPP